MSREEETHMEMTTPAEKEAQIKAFADALRTQDKVKRKGGAGRDARIDNSIKDLKEAFGKSIEEAFDRSREEGDLYGYDNVDMSSHRDKGEALNIAIEAAKGMAKKAGITKDDIVEALKSGFWSSNNKRRRENVGKASGLDSRDPTMIDNHLYGVPDDDLYAEAKGPVAENSAFNDGLNNGVLYASSGPETGDIAEADPSTTYTTVVPKGARDETVDPGQPTYSPVDVRTGGGAARVTTDQDALAESPYSGVIVGGDKFDEAAAEANRINAAARARAEADKQAKLAAAHASRMEDREPVGDPNDYVTPINSGGSVVDPNFYAEAGPVEEPEAPPPPVPARRPARLASGGADMTPPTPGGAESRTPSGESVAEATSSDELTPMFLDGHESTTEHGATQPVKLITKYLGESNNDANVGLKLTQKKLDSTQYTLQTVNLTDGTTADVASFEIGGPDLLEDITADMINNNRDTISLPTKDLSAIATPPPIVPRRGSPGAAPRNPSATDIDGRPAVAPKTNVERQEWRASTPTESHL